MEKKELFEKLNEVFREQFDDDTIVVTEETTAADIEDWDSLEHIDLIASVEETFGVHFTMTEVTHLKNVGEMASLIMRKLYPSGCFAAEGSPDSCTSRDDA